MGRRCPSAGRTAPKSFGYAGYVPKVEYIVQVDIGQNGGNHCTLRCRTLCAGMFPVLHNANLQPFADKPQDALVLYQVLEKFEHPAMIHGIEEPTDVCIKHPVHLPAIEPDRQCVQRIMLATPRPKPVGKA